MSLILRPLSYRCRKQPSTGKRDRRPRCPLLQHRRVDPYARLHLWRLDARRRETERATHPNGAPIILAVDATIADAAGALYHLGAGLYRVVARTNRVAGRQDYEARYAGAWPITPRRPSDAERLRATVDAERAARRQAEGERDAARADVDHLRAEVSRWKQALRARSEQIAALEAALEQSQRRLERARMLYRTLSHEPAEQERKDDESPDFDAWTERTCAVIERIAQLGHPSGADG